MKIASVKQMQNLDKTAIETYSISQEILMENASISAYELIKKKLDVSSERFVIFCGPGNNGGDGLALARKLHSAGADIAVILLTDPDKYTGSSSLNYSILQKIGLPLYAVSEIKKINDFISQYTVIVDAIFGVGLNRNIEGEYGDIIAAINLSEKKVLSLDIPSGINGNTGKLMGQAVEADFTVSFGLPKLGNLLYPGFKYNGQLTVSNISFPPKLYNDLKTQINTPLICPAREPDSHKNNYGSVLFIGGGRQYYGAPFFNSMGFLKSGGGYARLACPESIVPVLAARSSEIVFHPIQEDSRGNLGRTSRDAILELCENMRLVVLGCGMSTEDDSQELIKSLVQKIKAPIILDADGITAISKDLNILKERKALTVLTPHLGELSSLMDTGIEDIKKRQVELCKEFSKKFGVILMVKGAHSQIYSPDGRCYINLTGNSSLATAGSGDVLCGVIAAQYVLGLDLIDAVKNGVFIHGLCSEMISDEKGEDGVIAGDLLDFLPNTMKIFRTSFELIKKSHSIDII